MSENDKYEKLDSESLGPEGKKLLEHLEARIKGQENAVVSLAKAIDLYNSGLNDPRKPIHVALLIGPAAVGKTLLAQSLAEYWFDDPSAYVEIPCSDFRGGIDSIASAANFELNKVFKDNPELQKNVEENTKLKLEFDQLKKKILANEINQVKLKEKLEEVQIESRGDDKSEAKSKKIKDQLQSREEDSVILKKRIEEIQKKSSDLVDEIKKTLPLHSKSIVVFDHMEWADEEFNSFLCTILESGAVYDSQGNSFSLSNSVIFVTHSDAVNRGANAKIGFSSESKNESRGEVHLPEKEVYLGNWDQIKNFFEKKFLSRFDRTYIFRELTMNAMVEIVKEISNKFSNDICGEMKFPLAVRIENEVCDFIVKESMDHPEFGARLLKQKFDKYIRKPLGRLKNSGLIKQGDKLLVKLNEEKDDTVFLREKITDNPA